MKTDKELFDFVIDFLTEQGARSTVRDKISGKPMSAYRGDLGRRCAIGCLIEDKHYQSRFETHFFGKNLVCGAVMASLVIEAPMPDSKHRMLQALQHAHDCAGDNDFLGSLNAFAARFIFVKGKYKELKSVAEIDPDIGW